MGMLGWVAVDAAQFLSFLAALLLGRMSGAPVDGDWQRHVAIVGAAVNAIIHHSAPGALLGLRASI